MSEKQDLANWRDRLNWSAQDVLLRDLIGRLGAITSANFHDADHFRAHREYGLALDAIKEIGGDGLDCSGDPMISAEVTALEIMQERGK